MRFSSAGMEPDPMKVDAIEKAEPPANVSELKSFLGMTNYSCRFIRNYSDKTAKLRELLREKNEWQWTDEHQRCFDDLQDLIQGTNVLGCFNIKAHTKVIVDASPTEVGAMLVQTQNNDEDKVIA